MKKAQIYVQVYDTAFSHDVMAALCWCFDPNNENYFLFEKLVSFLMQTFLIVMAYQIIWALRKTIHLVEQA